MSLSTFFAYDPADDDDVRTEKFSIFLVAGGCSLAGLVWSAMYAAVFGFGLVALLPLAFAVIVGSAMVLAHISGNHRPLVYVQIICIIYITSFIQWRIGGVFESGFVLAWAFCGPIIALMYFSLRHAAVWLLLYLVNVLITVAFDDVFARHGYAVPNDTKMLFVAMNLSVSSLVVFVFASFYVSSAVSEREKANRLLLNILPEKTARTLKSHDGVIAEDYADVSVLFADIVDFTGYAATVPPDRLVAKLNEIFLRFDELTERYGLEKIKTVGDAYMVVGGLPEPRPDHLAAMAALALDMRAAVADVERDVGVAFSLRMGIHIGPVVAGVIGKRKFAYDLWGDTVNLASRLESSSTEDHIQVSEAVYRRLRERFRFRQRGTVDIKGIGPTETYFLLSPA